MELLSHPTLLPTIHKWARSTMKANRLCVLYLANGQKYMPLKQGCESGEKREFLCPSPYICKSLFKIRSVVIFVFSHVKGASIKIRRLSFLCFILHILEIPQTLNCFLYLNPTIPSTSTSFRQFHLKPGSVCYISPDS